MTMTLTIGTGPFGPQSGGVFNFTADGPAHVLYFEDYPRRVRAVFGGETVIDSRRVKLLHETGLLPLYYFPFSDVRGDLLEPTDHTTFCPFKGEADYRSVRVGDRVASNAIWGYPQTIPSAPPIAGYVACYWDAMDAWFEEDEEQFVHAPDPYHRVDVRASSRHVRVIVEGEVVAESRTPTLLFETSLPPRYYLPAADVRADVLVPSETTSRCPYKGTASYRSVRVGGAIAPDLVWTYPEPRAEVAQIAGLYCFYNERTDIEVDGELRPRPLTRFS
jgi:uncharacterized protein (DUF427 family)